jgi:hypothetical protein
MATDTAAAVRPQVLEELIGEINVASGTDRGGKPRRVSEWYAVRQMADVIQLRNAIGLFHSQKIHRHDGRQQQNRADCDGA